MPTKQFTDTHNFGMRDKLMRYELYERFLFNPFVGDIKVSARTNVGLLQAKDQIKMPNSIVWQLNGSEFINEGTDYVHMPMLLKLQQNERYGSHNLVGTGEDLRHKFRKLFINQMSGTVTLKKSEMDKIRTDEWEQYYKLGKPQLVDWYAERANANFISSIYEGHNLGVTEGLNESPDGIGVHTVLHPNMYYKSGNGALTTVGTEGLNKTHAEINAAVQAIAGTTPSAEDMYAIARTLTRRNVQKVMIDGSPLWLAMINLETWHNLIQDTTIRADYRAVATSSMYKNYLYAPTMYRWGDFVFLVDEIAARSWDSLVDDHANCPSGEDGSFRGQNGYHELPTVNTAAIGEVEPYPNTTITILGDGSIGYASIREPWTKFNVENYDQQKEMAMMGIYGLGRNDWIHKNLEATYYAGGNNDRTNIAANAVLNQSSAIFLVRQR